MMLVSYDVNLIRPFASPRRNTPKGRHPEKALSAAFVRSASPGRHADGNGLYLFVQPSGTRSWIQRLVIRGRRSELGLGSVALVSLAEAGTKALANRKLALEGGDPFAEKHRVRGIPSFAEATAGMIDQKKGGRRSAKQARDWHRSLEHYAFPRIGTMPVSDVNSADVLAILTPIWHVKTEAARLVRHRTRALLEWAIAMTRRTDNPGDRVVPILGPQNEIVEHRLALPQKDVAAAVQIVRDSSMAKSVKLAFEFLVLTAPRTGEVRGAVWNEIEAERRVWTVPALRMKMKRVHHIPLCDRALKILDAARKLGRERSAVVFPNEHAKPLDNKRLQRLLQKLRIAAVTHGFRSSFRDWAAEKTDHPREVIEAAPAHFVQNAVKAVYARSDLFERRRVLMEDWAAYLAQETATNPQR